MGVAGTRVNPERVSTLCNRQAKASPWQRGISNDRRTETCKRAIPLELGSDSAILLKTWLSIKKPIMKVPNENVMIAYTIFTRG
jgi:hypothetical protein